MRISRKHFILWLEKSGELITGHRDLLTQLDAAIGDADHGINMERGFHKVLEKLPAVKERDLGALFRTVGITLMSSVGGAAGPLYGAFYLGAGTVLAGSEETDASGLVAGLKAGVAGIVQRGRAEPGDKTMVDVWLPALEALSREVEAGASVAEALVATVKAAEKGVQDTVPLRARKGRASYLGERSIGHRDPGAVSSCLILRALQEALGN